MAADSGDRRSGASDLVSREVVHNVDTSGNS
jgi:hypothetical protein